MKFTFSWLLEHLDTDKTLEEITDKLSMIGLEVEDVTDKSKRLKDFIIAKVIDEKPHPNADRLKILSVDDNSGDIHQVICGATNAKKNGIKVIIYENKIPSDSLQSYEFSKDFESFCERSDVILANRFSDELHPFKYKVFSRDIFNSDL